MSTPWGSAHGRLAAALSWVVRLAGLNALWVLGVLAGTVIAGFAPSTAALASVVAAVRQGGQVEVWRTFWGTWRRELLRSQVRLALPFATIAVLAFYGLVAAGADNAAMRGIAVGIGLLTLMYIATIVHLPVLHVRFRLAPLDLWRITVIVAWRSPWHTLGILVASLAALGLMVVTYPAALLCYGASVPMLIADIGGARALSRARRPLRAARAQHQADQGRTE